MSLLPLEYQKKTVDLDLGCRAHARVLFFGRAPPPCMAPHTMQAAPEPSEVGRANVERIEQQIRDNMQKAFWDKVEQDAGQRPLTEPTIQWLGELYTDLRSRLGALTPQRADLQHELALALNPDALRDTLRHERVPKDKLEQMVRYVYGKLLALCAASQDRTVRAKQAGILGMLELSDPDLGVFTATFLRETHAILDTIEALLAKFREDVRTMPGVRPC